MKIIYSSLIILLLGIAFFSGEGIFTIIPQEIGLKQWLYIFVALAAFLGLVGLHLVKHSDKGLFLFFLIYPFLTQSVHYFNISSSFFVLTPAFLFLLLHLFLTKDVLLPVPLQLLALFCAVALLSIFNADNQYTAAAFSILASGSLILSAYLAYKGVRRSTYPWGYIRGITYSLILGSLIYLLIETVAFRLGPGDIFKIIMRKWVELPLGRYYTAGYIEPAGIGFVYSLFFWISLALVQSPSGNRKQKWFDLLALFIMVFFLIIAGTRGAVVNMIQIFVVLWILRRLFGLKSGFKIKPFYFVLLIIVIAVSIYYLVPRTILTARSAPPPSWIEPTYLTIGGRTFQLVGTTADYFKRTEVSLYDFLHKPLGSGPLNAPLREDNPEGGQGYYYSMISNLIVTGATFGWISLLPWLGFLFYVTYQLYRSKESAHRQALYALGVALLAILWASILPGTTYFGPMLNWTNFDYYSPLSPQTAGLPAEYPAVISGTLIGLLTGIIGKLSPSRKRVEIFLNGEENPPAIDQAPENARSSSFEGISS